MRLVHTLRPDGCVRPPSGAEILRAEGDGELVFRAPNGGVYQIQFFRKPSQKV